LFTGNTFVLKPSPYTPLSSLLLGQVLGSVFPPGVINVVSGGNDLGAWLTEHPDVAKVSFTGSVPTGKTIQRVCAADLKHVTLELGGNDAAIIMPDADVKKIAPKVFGAAFANNGQVSGFVLQLLLCGVVYGLEISV
jgi:acyl-CoA reductase-like NAD-dependent aldehyde dehydrogenase